MLCYAPHKSRTRIFRGGSDCARTPTNSMDTAQCPKLKFESGAGGAASCAWSPQRAGHVPSPPRSCRSLRFRFVVGPPRISVLRFRAPDPPPCPPFAPCFGCPPPRSVSDGRISAPAKTAGSTTPRASTKEDSGGSAPDEQESRLEGHGNVARKRRKARNEAPLAIILGIYRKI